MRAEAEGREAGFEEDVFVVGYAPGPLDRFRAALRGGVTGAVALGAAALALSGHFADAFVLCVVLYVARRAFDA